MTGVRVRSGHGSFVIEVVAHGGVPRGSAALPFNLEGQSAGELIDASGPVTDVRLETV